MLRININGRELTAQEGDTILGVALANGIDIPNLCQDGRVETYGACGLCLVEVNGGPKLLRACATKVADNMIISTETERVVAARKMALEMLLSDHEGDCRPPCRQACPGETDCQGYVGLIANGHYAEALELIKEDLPLPASIGRVCPHPCEAACRRKLAEEPIAIAWLKQFAADMDLGREHPFIPDVAESTGKRVALIGAGPASLTAAYFLAKAGHTAHIYEMMPQAGGMLRYGIPQYRLPKDVLDAEIAIIQAMGVEIFYNMKVGRDVTFDYLRNQYEAVFVGIGAWQSSALGCPGQDLAGVIGGIDFLQDVAMERPVSIGKRVAIVGGGNTAMDACRTAVRMGAEEVYLIYRRTKSEMPAEPMEIQEAEEEGVIFKLLVSPLEVLGEDGKVTGIRLQKMELGEPDASGRRSPVAIPGAEEILAVDTVIAAIGQKVVPDGLDGLELTAKNTIVTDVHNFTTSLPGVFAGGDGINRGPDIAIAAIGHGKKAARSINAYLAGEPLTFTKPFLVERKNVTAEMLAHIEKQPRVEMPHLAAADRKTNFREINTGFTEAQAVTEASRCLSCGCMSVFDCKLLEYANRYQVEPEKLAGGEVHHRREKDDHPFIERNIDKCVLCGLCVRVCEEAMGVNAIGLLNRGFETSVQPSFERKLADTECISCGQCAALCPTGALTVRQPGVKSVPLNTERIVESVCGYCSVGCKVQYHMKGDVIIKVTPAKDSFLCAKGRFGLNWQPSAERITGPLLVVDGELQETYYDDAFLAMTRELRAIQSAYGKDSVAMSLSGKLTNEEIFLAKKIAASLGISDQVYSSQAGSYGIADIIGDVMPKTTFAELETTDLIIACGLDLLQEPATLVPRIRKALARGAKLILVDNRDTLADQWATAKYTPDDTVSFWYQVAKELLTQDGLQLADQQKAALEKQLANIKVGRDAKAFAAHYLAAKNSIFLLGGAKVSDAAGAIIAGIAAMARHLGKPRNGIIQLKPSPNAYGILAARDVKPRGELVENIAEGKVKALFTIGDFYSAEELQGLSYLAVMDHYYSPMAMNAQVVLPLALPRENVGVYTSAEGRCQQLRPAVSLGQAVANWETLAALGDRLGANTQYECFDLLQKETAAAQPKKTGCHKCAVCSEVAAQLFPITEDMLQKAIAAFGDEKAAMWKKPVAFDYTAGAFMAYLKQRNITK
ncbi:MAG: FAD-dependent oxidoreductase [Peptococcaceae bacterium]|nr:FAD-dependent oxidoreductase [Peptococcaceae bacterium]